MKRTHERSRGAYRPDFVTESSFGEIKHGLSAIRTLRNALAQLLRGLTEWEDKTAYLVLVDPRVSDASLADEMRVFETALRPEIGERLRLITVRDGEISGAPSGIEPSDLETLRREAEASGRLPFSLPRPDKQSEVLRVVLHQWVTGEGQMTADWVARVVGCNYRTVAAMLEKLGPAVDRREDRRFQLNRFPAEAWARFIATSRTARATTDYVDRSGHPRSPESMLRRLRNLGREDIAVGGTMGAKHYCPQLDIVGAPRLDLCVHSPGTHTDLDFIEHLDAALVRAESSDAKPRVAIHFVRRAEPLFRRGDSGTLWADPIECLADLYEAGLDTQGMELQAHLTSERAAADGR